ncbi:MAG: ribosome-associated translation inhibitor RaiA [Actinomycetota bacterium]
MEFVVTGRGIRVTDQIREAAEHKLARLTRMEPRATRIEIEITVAGNPRLRGSHHVEAVLRVPRATFRAQGRGPDVPTALDQLADRLERQVRDHHGRRRPRPPGKGNGLESAHA